LRKSNVPLKKTIRPQDFARLCRKLDLGEQYQKHINHFYWPKTTTGAPRRQFAADSALRERYELQVKAHIAFMKGEIDQSAFDLLISLGETPRWKGKPVRCCRLEMLDIAVPQQQTQNDT
ncbi:dermonecrotic toxin domain-containing protein, partial [Pseudomonas agarici]